MGGQKVLKASKISKSATRIGCAVFYINHLRRTTRVKITLRKHTPYDIINHAHDSQHKRGPSALSFLFIHLPLFGFIVGRGACPRRKNIPLKRRDQGPALRSRNDRSPAILPFSFSVAPKHENYARNLQKIFAFCSLSCYTICAF